MPEELIPLLAVGMIFMIPIVAILTKHQQKMAEIFRQQQQHPLNLQDGRQSEELAKMRELMTQQMIAIDNLAQSQRELAVSIRSQQLSSSEQDLRERIGLGNG